MNKKLIFVIQIEADEKYESAVRQALDFIRQKVVTLFDGQMQIDEVKLQD